MNDRIQKYLAQREQHVSETPSFEISGHFTDDAGVHVDSVSTAPMTFFSFPTSGCELLLLDASGEEIACNGLERQILHTIPPMPKNWKPGRSLGCYPHITREFSATVPQIEGGVTLAIERDGVRLWTRHAPEQIPVITGLTCVIDGGTGRLEWTDTVPHDSPQYIMRAEWQTEDGACGRLSRCCGDTHMIEDNQQFPRNLFEFSLAELPSGAVGISVTLDSGFHTAHSDAVTVVMPVRPIEIELITPEAAFGDDLSEKLMILATAQEFAGTWGRITEPTAFEWTIDDQPIGSGSTMKFDPPVIGHHTVTVVVNWRGQRATKSINFEVTQELLTYVEQYCIEMKQLFSRRYTPG